MHPLIPSWYGARTKPKHEHIAAANLRKHLGLEVFSPRLRREKLTRRGLVRILEPLFPGYIFVRCVVEDKVADIQHTTGVSRLVQFGGKIPSIPDLIIGELQHCFGLADTVEVENTFGPGMEVTVAIGAFAGMSALVLKNLPAKKRVQILLEVLGRPTPVEMKQDALLLKKNSVADLMPVLAAPARPEMLRV